MSFRQLTMIAFLAVALSTPLIALIKSGIEFWDAKVDRVSIILRGIAILSIWAGVSGIFMFMLFAQVYFMRGGTTKGVRDLSVTAGDKSEMPWIDPHGYPPAGHDTMFFIPGGAPCG